MREKFLPLGTVCMLENATKAIMIIGYLPTTQGEPIQTYDYTGVMFPEGLISSNQNAVFNHSQIKEIISLGFENEESKDFIERVKELVVKNNIVPTQVKIDIPKPELNQKSDEYETL